MVISRWFRLVSLKVSMFTFSQQAMTQSDSLSGSTDARPRRIISVRHLLWVNTLRAMGELLSGPQFAHLQDEEDELSRSGKQVVAWSAVCV